MPCMDYSPLGNSNFDDILIRKQKDKLDMLSRIACLALTELEEGNPNSNIFKNKEVMKWWPTHKEADARAQELLAKEEDLKKKKKAALSKLSDDEREVLGLPKRKPKYAAGRK